jgi:heme iron utilization protein
MSNEKPKLLRNTDDEARQKARHIILAAGFAAIAVIDPETGYPNSSRVLTATDGAGMPVILVSHLAAHTKALLTSPRCSLLLGEPGKGDPLAWPRLSLQCDGRPVGDDDPERAHLRDRFLRRHPKAALYADFPDFLYIRLTPVSASLNGGFGRAYALTAQDFRAPGNAPSLSPDRESKLIEQLEGSESLSPGDRVAAVTERHILLENKGKQRIAKISEILKI